MHAELPGFDKEDINVSFHDGFLSIDAKHQEKSESKDEDGYMLKERRIGSYTRHFNFGNKIIASDINAKYEQGVLELTLPKVYQESTKSKQKINIS